MYLSIDDTRYLCRHDHSLYYTCPLSYNSPLCNQPNNQTPSQLRNHIPHARPLPRTYALPYLLPTRPSIIHIPQCTRLHIRLPRHDSALHVKHLFAAFLNVVFDVEEALRVVDELVGGGNIADEPGVHVWAARLDEGAFGGLFWRKGR